MYANTYHDKAIIAPCSEVEVCSPVDPTMINIGLDGETHRFAHVRVLDTYLDTSLIQATLTAAVMVT
jgi:hypothetical protein